MSRSGPAVAGFAGNAPAQVRLADPAIRRLQFWRTRTRLVQRINAGRHVPADAVIVNELRRLTASWSRGRSGFRCHRQGGSLAGMRTVENAGWPEPRTRTDYLCAARPHSPARQNKSAIPSGRILDHECSQSKAPPRIQDSDSPIVLSASALPASSIHRHPTPFTLR